MPIPVRVVENQKQTDFDLVGGHPALDLVNTLDWRFRDGDSEELLGTYGDVLRFAEQSRLLTRSQVRRVSGNANGAAAARVLALTKQLREAAADVFYASLEARTAPAAALKTLESIFKAVRPRQQLSAVGSSLGWTWPQADTPPELPFWRLSTCVESLMLSAEMQRLRECANVECRWLFLDTCKNHTRRWCDMKICGNRMKARRFKAQRRG